VFVFVDQYILSGLALLALFVFVAKVNTTSVLHEGDDYNDRDDLEDLDDLDDVDEDRDNEYVGKAERRSLRREFRAKLNTNPVIVPCHLIPLRLTTVMMMVMTVMMMVMMMMMMVLMMLMMMLTLVQMANTCPVKVRCHPIPLRQKKR